MGLLGVVWGIGGVLALLGVAVLKLTPPAFEVSNYSLHWYHWVVLIVNGSLVLYFKGYRALHLALAPRIAARAKYLYQNPTLLRLVLAPLFCIGFFQIQKRKGAVTYGMTVFMVLVIIMVRQFDQPWRGIVDMAVAAGLSIGLLSVVLRTAQSFSSAQFDYSPMMAD